jgi:hypothetical protein
MAITSSPRSPRAGSSAATASSSRRTAASTTRMPRSTRPPSRAPESSRSPTGRQRNPITQGALGVRAESPSRSTLGMAQPARAGGMAPSLQRRGLGHHRLCRHSGVDLPLLARRPPRELARPRRGSRVRHAREASRPASSTSTCGLRAR